jgi:hypothetical protein
MKRNIIIAGVPRAGKTTLSRMTAKYGYAHISMDAIIAGFERCFPETGISTYQDLSSWDTLHVVSGKIAPFIRAMIDGEYSGYELGRAVFDVYQLLPGDYVKHFDGAGCKAFWIGSSDITPEERFAIQKKFDTERDYTFDLPDDERREGCGYIVEQSRFMKQQCEIHGLPYRDTSYNREAVLNEILTEILES